MAGPSNEGEVENFFEQFSLKSVLDIKIKRPSGFTAPYKLQSDDFETYLLREKDGSLQGLASFIYRDTYFENRPQKIAFATDLRILPSRKAILEWPNHFLPVLRDILKNKGVSGVLSAINTQDPIAFNAFVRPRTVKRPLPRYHLYRKFQLVTLHGKFPWAPPPVKGLRLVRGSENHLEALVEYIQRRAPYRAFSTAWDEKSLFQKMNRLPGFTLKNFWLALDSNGRVVGTVAPWSPLKTQEYCPLSYSLRAHNFRQFLKFAKPLGWTHPLTKPLSRTGEEAPLKFKFLTFASADNEDIFESLLWQAFENTPKDEFLAYSHSLLDFRLNPPKSWITARLPFGLYAVIPPEMDPPGFLHPTQLLNPEIEACYFF